MKFLTALGAILAALVVALALTFLEALGFAWLFALVINQTFAFHLHALHLFPLVLVASVFIFTNSRAGKSAK
jgi:hypothetical protein